MKRLSSKLAAFLLVAVMVVSLFPAAVFAEDTDVEESDTSSTTFSAYAVDEAEDIQEELELPDETYPEAMVPDLNADAFYQEYNVGNLKVTVSYEAGTVPEGTEVVVSVAKPEAIEAIKAEKGEDISYAGADISFVFEGKEIEPKDFSDNKVTVTLEYVGEEDLTGAGFGTLHVNETIDEEGEVVYGVETVEATMTDIVETVTKYTEVPVYETREITEERTTMVTKTREVEKTKTVKVKVKVKWYDPSTWSGYKYETQKYTVTETYEEPITETVVLGTEEVQVGTETVEDGTEEIVVGQTAVFEADNFSTFIMYFRTNRTVTIHHGVMINNAFVEFGTNGLPASSNSIYGNLNIDNYGTNNSNRYAYLIYDFPGYTYYATYYRTNTSTTPASGGTAIRPALRKDDDYYNYYWYYRGANSNNWNNAAANGSHIYVIYTAKTISPGADGSGGGGGGDQQGFVPDVGKNVSDQKADGTYDITLGFVGDKQPASYAKARVIVVFDRSGSMDDDISSTDSTDRIVVAKRAVNAMADRLLALTDDSGNKLVEMGIVSFGTNAQIETFGNNVQFTSTASTFTDKVNSFDADMQGTNWEKALDLANSMQAATDSKTYIVFISDGDPTFRISRGNYRDYDSGGVVGLANENIDYPNNTVDGQFYLYNVFGYGSDSTGYATTTIPRNYEAAEKVAESIVGANKTLFVVGLSSSVTRMENLANDAGGTYYDGSNATTFANNMAEIAGQIEEAVGLTDMKITDGVTDMSQVSTKSLVGTAEDFQYFKSYPLTKEGNNYTYQIGNTPYTVTQAQVDEGTDGTHRIFSRQVDSVTVYYIEYPWEGAPEAEVDDNNSVVWDTSEANSELEHGVYYSVKFTVWPKQEAYDLIADLDNKIRKVTDTDLEAETKAQLRVVVDGTTYEYNTDSGKWTDPTGTITKTDAELQALIEDETKDAAFSMKTNTGLSADYKYGGVDMPTATYTNYTNGNMSLDDTSINIKKTWNNYMDAREASNVTLTITRTDEEGNTENYFDIVMGEPVEEQTQLGGKHWVQTPEQDLFISLGVMSVTGDTVTIREKGYDYTVVEPENFSYRWDLSADIYHPMVINGTTTVLIEVEDTTGLPDEVKNLAQNKTVTSGGKTYYAFEGKLYVTKTGENALVLEATNDRRSNLIINKVVDETDAPADDLFPIQITNTNPNDPLPGQTGYNTWYHTFWFFVSTESNDRDSIIFDDIEVSDNVTPEISELRTNNTDITNIVTHEADDTHSYPYITYNYKGTPNTVKAVDLELHDGSEVVDEETINYQYYSYYTGFYWFDNGATATVWIKDGWYINFNNMGKDTTYTIVEPTADMPDAYTLEGTTTAATNTQNEQVTPGTVSEDKTTVTGTIGKPNSDYKATYDNKYEGVFYVYHSSNNEVERFPMATNGVAYSSEKTFSIYGLTAEGTLYGGYYDGYAGKSDGFDLTAAAALDYSGESNPKDENGTPYDYAYIKAINKAAWDDATAYTVSGDEMTPVKNTIYYLKEVPTGYLQPYTYYTYYATDGKLADLWAISALDDLNYGDTGFYITNVKTGATSVVSSLSIKAANSNTTVKLTANKSFAKKGVKDGYLSYAKISNKIGSKIMIQQYWITPDEIEVFGTMQRELDTTKANKADIASSDSTYVRP